MMSLWLEPDLWGLLLLAMQPKMEQKFSCLRNMGGKETTPTDALKVLGLIEVGDPERASEAIKVTASELGLSETETASLIVDKVSGMIADAVNEMFLEWEQEPAYRVWEVLQEKSVRPDNVVGIGGGAKGLIAEIAKKLGAKPVIPEYAEVGNAIGAAVARPTLTLNLHIDTEQKIYSVAEEGKIVNLSTTNIGNLNKIHLDEAEALAAKLLRARAENFGISKYAEEAEIVDSEVFNVVNGWHTSGRLFDVNMQIPAGLIPEWKRREKA